jgi:ABC-2 type transport system permease protein
LRGLLTGTPIGDNGVLAMAWCSAITVAGYIWARRLYDKGPAVQPH